MTISITKKGIRLVKLIRAVQAAGALVPGDPVRVANEHPAAYIGPVQEGGIQMHAFQLFDGMEVVLEAPALNRELRQVGMCELQLLPAPGFPKKRLPGRLVDAPSKTDRSAGRREKKTAS